MYQRILVANRGEIALRIIRACKELGVETVWLSPFFRSPQLDHGYDSTDHFEVAPEYGDSADVEQLFREAHARGLKVVLDIVLIHTSSQHPWFLAS